MKPKSVILASFAIALMSMAVLSCVDPKVDYAKGGGIEQETVMPLVPEGGMVRFYLDAESGSLRTSVGGSKHTFSSSDEVYVKSTVYNPIMSSDGAAYVDIPESKTGTYKMFCYPQASKDWFLPGGEYPLRDLIIPYSQFYETTVDQLATYPMLGEYSEATGNKMVFKEVIAALDITLKGNAKIASVHVRNKATEEDVAHNLAGVASYDLEKGYVLYEGVNFVNLNCTNDGDGVKITDGGTHFYLLLSKGNYSKGLTLTVTDMDHKGQVFDIPAFEVAAGQMKPFSFTYAPASDLLFFEHFDNFVWGGNVQGNSAVMSYAPTAAINLNDNPTERKGTENAFTKVSNTTPGSAFIQANWATVSGWTVGERPTVSKEYVRSRNIADLTYMYRCQEFQGCVSCGGADETRGAYQIARFPQFKGKIYTVKISYDVCFRYGTEDTFCSHVNDGGIVTEVKIDGVPLTLETEYNGNNTYTHGFLNTCTMSRKDLKAPTSDEYKDGWHHVEMTIENVGETTAISLWGVDTGTSIKHGHYIDNVEIYGKPYQAPSKKIRVMVYNVQNGMWSDQGNGFNNFVEWMKQWDVDICVFCESQSIYSTGTASSTGTANWQLFTNMKDKRSNTDATSALTDPKWAALAKRWGHNYHAISGYRDNYPQVITSRTPITTVRRIVEGSTSGQYIMHGAGHFRVTAGGQSIDIVSVHLWPQAFWPGRQTQASIDKQEGRDYQKYEATSIMNKTFFSSTYSSVTNWLLMGDTNSISPLDMEYYEQNELYEPTRTKWVYANTVFSGAKNGKRLYDLPREGAGAPYKGPGRFLSSAGASRIDLMYGSESMRKRATVLSTTIRDEWSNPRMNPLLDPDSGQSFCDPSDHRPVLVEFDMSK